VLLSGKKKGGKEKFGLLLCGAVRDVDQVCSDLLLVPIWCLGET
jgi:hypothetical protein